jgi:probable H4MPT-linked C1 transfer pathway protein
MIRGWDLGGAHVKLAELDADGHLVRAQQAPCRLWLGMDQLEQALLELGGGDVRHVRHAVTMTGELVDLFPDRAAGVDAIIGTFLRVTGAQDVVVLAGDALVAPDEARERWHEVASANWRATARLAARLAGEALVIDVGSTTTDLMLVAGGIPVDGATDDHERLAAQTLVYTGVVRTPLMALARHVPFRGRTVGLMAEYFATTGDVYRILGTLDPACDHADTADGRGKSKAESIVRLARMVGLDAAQASVADWEALAAWFARLQLDHIRHACERQLSRSLIGNSAPVVGLGAGQFLAQRLAAELGRPHLDFASLAGIAPEHAAAVGVCGPAFAVASLARTPRA